MAADELDSQEVVGQVNQILKEQYFKKQGSLKQGDEQKAVIEAEKIVGIETHNTG